MSPVLSVICIVILCIVVVFFYLGKLRPNRNGRLQLPVPLPPMFARVLFLILVNVIVGMRIEYQLCCLSLWRVSHFRLIIMNGIVPRIILV